MIVRILSIKLFVNTIFKDSFEKYVDDSNKVEVNHLIEWLCFNKLLKFD